MALLSSLNNFLKYGPKGAPKTNPSDLISRRIQSGTPAPISSVKMAPIAPKPIMPSPTYSVPTQYAAPSAMPPPPVQAPPVAPEAPRTSVRPRVEREPIKRPKVDDSQLRALELQLSRSLLPSKEEEAAQRQYNNILTSEELGVQAVRDKPIPMQFITGQSESIMRNAAIQARPLKDQLALLQARRQAAADVAKTQYMFESDRVDREYDIADKEYERQLGSRETDVREVGGNLVRLNSDTGEYEVAYQAPAKEQSVSEKYGSGIIGEYNYYAEQERAAGRQPVSFNAYQNMDTNRKVSIARSGVAGSSGTQTDRDRALKTSAIAKATPELRSNTGSDGYADPSVYLRLRSDYAQAVGDVSEFDAAFSSLLSPRERARLGIGKATGINADDYEY